MATHDSESAYRAAVEASPDAVLVVDADGEVTLANTRAGTLLGREPEALQGRHCEEVLSDLETVGGDPIDGGDHPFVRVETTGEPVEGQRIALETPEGRREVTVSAGPRWTDDGAFDGTVLSLRDVTADNKLPEGTEHVEAVIGNSPVVLFAFDPEGTFTLSRGRGLERLELESGGLNGTSVFDLYADNPDIVEACERALDGETVRAVQHVGEFVFETQYHPVTDDTGDVQEVIGLTLDITERKKHEKRLETLMETVPASVFMTSADGEMQYINDTGREMLDLGTDRVAGRHMSEVLPAESESSFGAHHREALERGEPVEREQTPPVDDGRTVSTTVAPIDDETEEQTGVVGVARDVTERKDRERRLEENDAILTQLTETTDDVFWLFDGEFSELQFINDAYEEVWGRSVADLQADAMDFMEGVHPEDRELVAERVEKLRGGEPTDGEYRVNPEENFGRWVWVRGEPVFDENGEIERVAGFARDITERKRRERELERRERQFEAVFNDPQLLVGILDPDGTIRRVNETSLDVSGATRAEIEGTPLPETPWWSYDEQLRAKVREWLARAADGEYVEFEAEHPLPDGGEIAVKGNIRPVFDGDEVVSLIASSRDVTERRERERALERSNERLEQFAYVASHDLQEPLRTVANYVEMLAEEYDDDLDEEAREIVDVAVTASERMQSMINGLVDYSRVTTRGEEFEPVDVEEVVASVAEDLQVVLEEENGHLEWGELPTVEGDRDQLRQVIQNLVTNAVEHADGPVEMEIRAAETRDGYRFEVEDDGPGIAANRQEKIFRIFKSGTQYQTASQAKGIGLAVCDSIVQRHDGELWVESEPGEGATFAFTIPDADDTGSSQP